MSMEGLVLGIDLCDNYTQISCAEEERTWTIPTVICKNTHTDEWCLGESEGVDHLISLFLKNEKAMLHEVYYYGKQLLEQFLLQAITFVQKDMETKEIARIVFSMSKSNGKLVKLFQQCGEKVGVSRKHVHTINYVESMIYYILSQKKEIWGNAVALFYLLDNQISYYELDVQRGKGTTIVVADYQHLEEGIISEESSKNQVLCTCAERLMGQKSFSSVFLSGRGFDEFSWADEFIKTIGKRQRLYAEPAIFSKGAFYKGVDYEREVTAYPYPMLCEGRLRAGVSLPVIVRGQEQLLEIATIGTSWYTTKKSLEVLLDNQNTIDFYVTPYGSNKKKQIQIPLEELPNRPNKTTKVRVKIVFLDDHKMEVTVQDRGFGELFPATTYKVKQEVTI